MLVVYSYPLAKLGERSATLYSCKEEGLDMKLHTLFLLLVLALIAAFAALNWSVFITPTDLSLGYTTVQMPMGLLMLGLLFFLSALFLVYVVYLQGSVLLETRRQSRDLQANRELADRAEASRFTELRPSLRRN